MRTRYRKILVAAALTALASMAIFASAANAATPAPPYQDFAGCPSPEENPFTAECIKYTFTGGQIGVGNRQIPVTNPIVLRGGYEQETGDFLFNAEGGIVPVRQTVPGGLIGLTGYKWLDEAIANSNQLKLYATVELAGQPNSILEATRVLPIKVHLENQYLGNSCYVGSNSNPITLNLTTGTTSPPAPNTPITGQKPSPLTPEAERPEVLTAADGIYVDNAYAVPAAAGCQLNLGSFHASIDKVVNSAYGLPSAAGKNTAVLDFNRSVVPPSVVYP
ncbi:MAG TPA: hypothetical protein VJ204_04020 [Solirubrobacterales bacterium]|nr:hypothetical protein [Solirubrobacterales bacterium]